MHIIASIWQVDRIRLNKKQYKINSKVKGIISDKIKSDSDPIQLGSNLKVLLPSMG